MQTVSLGFQVPDYNHCCAPVSPEPAQRTKTAYPSFCIPGNRELAKTLKVDQEFTAVVKFRVKEIAVREKSKDSGPSWDDQYDGTRVELEANEMTIKDMKMEESEDEPDFTKLGKKS